MVEVEEIIEKLKGQHDVLTELICSPDPEELDRMRMIGKRQLIKELLEFINPEGNK